MARQSQLIRCALVFSCAALSLDGRESLSDNSPFIPQGWQPEGEKTQTHAPPPPAPGRFVFQGVYLIGETWSCNLLDTSTGKSSWINPGQSVRGAVVLQYDPTLDTLYLLIDGKETGLRLKDLPANTQAPIPASNDTHRQVPPGTATRTALAKPALASPASAQLARTIRPSGDRRLPSASSRETQNFDSALASLEATYAQAEPQSSPLDSLPRSESSNYNPRVFAGQARNSTP